MVRGVDNVKGNPVPEFLTYGVQHLKIGEPIPRTLEERALGS